MKKKKKKKYKNSYASRVDHPQFVNKDHLFHLAAKVKLAPLLPAKTWSSEVELNSQSPRWCRDTPEHGPLSADPYGRHCRASRTDHRCRSWRQSSSELAFAQRISGAFDHNGPSHDRIQRSCSTVERRSIKFQSKIKRAKCIHHPMQFEDRRSRARARARSPFTRWKARGLAARWCTHGVFVEGGIDAAADSKRAREFR